MEEKKKKKIKRRHRKAKTKKTEAQSGLEIVTKTRHEEELEMKKTQTHVKAKERVDANASEVPEKKQTPDENQAKLPDVDLIQNKEKTEQHQEREEGEAECESVVPEGWEESDEDFHAWPKEGFLFEDIEANVSSLRKRRTPQTEREIAVRDSSDYTRSVEIHGLSRSTASTVPQPQTRESEAKLGVELKEKTDLEQHQETKEAECESVVPQGWE